VPRSAKRPHDFSAHGAVIGGSNKRCSSLHKQRHAVAQGMHPAPLRRTRAISPTNLPVRCHTVASDEYLIPQANGAKIAHGVSYVIELLGSKNSPCS